MIIIDFEASSLGKDSHPIEVAWGTSPENIESYLLNPGCMEGWTDWNPKSFYYHGISRGELLRFGHDPRYVAARMAEVLSGEPVYSDEPHYDIRWKNRLLADSGVEPSLVKILDLKTRIREMIRTRSCSASFNELLCAFECSRPERHRAEADVRWLLEFTDYVRKSCCGG
ncbi:MAG: hypothetical protein ACOC0W_07035 [Desulfosalsimonas sp.]